MNPFPKILIIAVYMGDLPDYFPLWLTSCRFNSKFDWLVITDADVTKYDKPTNVHFVRMTLDVFANRMAIAAGVAASLKHPYKICDFRPLFWSLLDEAPGQWDFWGHCDIDMLFGDLSRFISSDILKSHDKIFGVGHFTLYRNNDIVNKFYTREHPELNYISIFSDHNHRGFDEHIGVNRIWRMHRGRFFEDETNIADIDPQISHFERAGSYHGFRNYQHQVFCFENGSVKRLYWHAGKLRSDEFMYIHFQKRKFRLPLPSVSTERFYITPDGFVPMASTPPDRAMLDHLNPRSASWKDLVYRARRSLRSIRRRMPGRERL